VTVSDQADRYPVEVLRDVRIPTADPGVTLSGDLFLPRSGGKAPALVTLLPYRKDAGAGIGGWASFHWFASRGYACLLVDFRGTGSSDGHARAPFDPAEADDGVAAIEWCAAQDWCTGAVGMWGVSYGAITSMRTATRHPRHLRAILPIMGMLDPERDFIHPAGSRGALAPLGVWAMSTLVAQLLPPLNDFHNADEQGRWQQRLHETEPYLTQLHRTSPGDPVWRTRTIDATAIAVPTFCIAGWRDLFCDGTLRAYEQITAPKQLLAGPWMHTIPHESPFEPVDFHTMALHWWRRWLDGDDSAATAVQPPRIYVQGARPRWEQMSSWPPPAVPALFRSDGAELHSDSADPEPVTAPTSTYRLPDDPTIGSQSGLWAIPTTGFGLPLDQHEDDAAALSFTSGPLEAPLLLAGRPEVTVTIAPGARVPDRLVAKLADVAPDRASTLITVGLVLPTPTPPKENAQRISWLLNPTAHEVAAAHHLRLILSDGDIPRLWPLPRPSAPEPIADHVEGISRATVTLPTVCADADHVELSPMAPPFPGPELVPLGLTAHEDWSTTRDLITGDLRITIVERSAAFIPGPGHRLEIATTLTSRVPRNLGDAARIEGSGRAVAHLSSGETITLDIALLVTATFATAHTEIDIDGTPVFDKRWTANGSPRRAGGSCPPVPQPPRPPVTASTNGLSR
jgi:uncharacterized protein